MFQPYFFALHVVCFLRINPPRAGTQEGYFPRFVGNGHKSLTYHLGSWLLTTTDSHYLLPDIDAAVRMHLMSKHCEGSWELRFIIAAKTYDPINIPSTFGNDCSVQRGKHRSSQTWCDEVFQLAVREHHDTVKLLLQLFRPQILWTDGEPMVAEQNNERYRLPGRYLLNI